MGEAKRRGPREVRVAEAEARIQRDAAEREVKYSLLKKQREAEETQRLFALEQEKARRKAEDAARTPEQRLAREAMYRPNAFGSGLKRNLILSTAMSACVIAADSEKRNHG